ncbi:exported hypothetical protein [Bradyrhizobium sp. STM 3843]|nr:exported hypothetical protein [Bradyrhizobium sp. STM 3843]
MLTERRFLMLAAAIGGPILSSCASSAPQQSRGQWSSLPLGAGGFITGRSISNDGKNLVCRADTYGCYTWNNDTSKWEQLRTSTRMPSADVAPANGLSEAGGYEIQVAPSDSNRIYMASDEGLVKIRSVPGHAGHVFACSGPLNPANQPYAVFMRSTDGCANFIPIANVQCVHAFGFGKAAPGSDHPAVYIAGLYEKRWGVYRSTDHLAAWNANTIEWLQIGDYPLGNYDMITTVEGDANEFGTVYVGFSGSGGAYFSLAA